MSHIILEPDRKELRNFALILGAGVAVIGGVVLPWRMDYQFPIWPWIIAGIFSLLGLIAPLSLAVPYKIWMRFGLMMNAIMSRLILGVVYYLVVVPIGMILRITGKDSMGAHYDKAARSYRIISQKTNIDQMRKPF